MLCTVEQRDRIRAARDRLETFEQVEATDVLDPHRDRSARWTIEVVLCADGIPPQVLDTLGSYRLTLRTAQPQGPNFWVLVATV